MPSGAARLNEAIANADPVRSCSRLTLPPGATKDAEGVIELDGCAPIDRAVGALTVALHKEQIALYNAMSHGYTEEQVLTALERTRQLEKPPPVPAPKGTYLLTVHVRDPWLARTVQVPCTSSDSVFLLRMRLASKLGYSLYAHTLHSAGAVLEDADVVLDQGLYAGGVVEVWPPAECV